MFILPLLLLTLHSEEMDEEPLPFDDFAATIIQNWWQAPRLALVLPFIDSQIETKLRPTIERWADPRYQPCLGSSHTPSLPVTAYFYHPGTATTKLAEIEALWDEYVGWGGVGYRSH